MKPAVSLYIPCYNARRFLEGTLRAIERQTFQPSEVIVVDDGSTDDIEGIAKSHGTVYVRHPINRGLAAARNMGVRVSSNEYLASLDADCQASPSWLESLVRWIDRGAAGAGGRLLETNTATLPDRWRESHMKQEWGDRAVVNPPFLFGSNTLFRKEALVAAGGYDERLRTNYEDVDLSEKIRRRGVNLVYEPEAVAYHQRTDSIQSVAETYWRWENPSPEVKYPGGRSALGGIWWDTRTAARLILSDAARGREVAVLPLAFWLTWVRMSVAARSRLQVTGSTSALTLGSGWH